MRSDICPFCGHHPYEYVDIGVGSVPCAVTCCENGDAFFRGARPDPEEVTMTYADFVEIGNRLPVWRDIETAPKTEETHIRGLWVYRAKTGEPLYWQSDLGSLNEACDFVSADGEDFGWRADDYTHWMPLPSPPETTQ